MAKDVKETLKKIKDLLAAAFKDEPADPVVPPVDPVTPPVEPPAEPPAEPVVEPPVEPVVEPQKFADTPDLAAMQAEIDELRKQCQVMGEYVYLKEECERLKKQCDQMTVQMSEVKTAFEETIKVVEFMADKPTGEPAQTPKDGLKKKNIEKYF